MTFFYFFYLNRLFLYKSNISINILQCKVTIINNFDWFLNSSMPINKYQRQQCKKNCKHKEKIRNILLKNQKSDIDFFDFFKSNAK